MERKGRKRLFIIAFLVTVVGALVAIPLFSHDGEASAPDIVEKNDVAELEILCVGDVMAHMSQVKAQQQSDGSYSFVNNFEYVRDYISEADIAICNVETTFGGPPYTGFPSFSSPDELAAALSSAGFDVAVTANNHMADRGLNGILRTIEVLKADGMQVTGSRESADLPRYTIYETEKGVNVAVVAYTYETPSSGGRATINGSVISQEAEALINSFNTETLDSDMERVRGTIEEARAAGADIVVMYYHWGEEYQNTANRWQRDIAQRTAAMGADMIFASHPHNLQEMETITLESGKRVPVFYSMGNFISNQRRETLGEDKKKTETGCIARVFLTYDKNAGEITSISADAIPTWVDRYSDGGRLVYAVVPLDEELDGNASLAVSGHLSRAKSAWEEANGLLGID